MASPSYAASSGKATMISPTPARHASPPDTTETRVDVSDATEPDSTSPSRGPPDTTRLNTDDIRPRIRSGVSVWEIVVRHTALTLSAAPATASRRAASAIVGIKPAAAIAAPHTVTAPITIR